MKYINSKFNLLFIFYFIKKKAFSKNLPKKIAFITKEFHPERDCLNAYIVFEKKESAQKAIELNGTLFNEKHMRVDLEGGEKVNINICIYGIMEYQFQYCIKIFFMSTFFFNIIN